MSRRPVVFLIVAAAAALALVAAGCGGSKHKGTNAAGADGSGNGTASVPRRASQTLTLYGFGTGDEVAQARTKLAMKAVAPARVTNPTGGFEDQAFLTRVASGDVPDLVYMDRQKVGTYAAKGALMPLT